MVEAQQLLVRRDEHAAARRLPHEVDRGAQLALRRRRVHRDARALEALRARRGEQLGLGVVPHDDDAVARLAAARTQDAALHRLVDLVPPEGAEQGDMKRKSFVGSVQASTSAGAAAAFRYTASMQDGVQPGRT